MPIKSYTKGLWIVGICFLALNGYAASFTSTDEAFTLDLPSGWREVSPLPKEYVLRVAKGSARLDIKTVACTIKFKCVFSG